MTQETSTEPTPPSMGVRLLQTIAPSIGLLVLLVIFSCLGAKMFMVIEGPHESAEKYDIVDMRQDIIRKLWNSSHRLSIDQKGFADFVKEEMKRYEATLYSAFAQGINSDSDETIWDFWGSFIYCTTIYTTVGYGHMAPSTNAGRIATILYGLIGIPLCLIVLTELGRIFTLAIKYPLSLIQRNVTVNDEFNLSPVIALVVGAIYCVLGSVMYTQWEDWDYFEAVYFIFISISTVGFGDVLPSNKESFVASFLYQLIGLALIGMIINVVMEVVQSHISGLKQQAMAVAKGVGVPMQIFEDMEKKTV